MDAPDLAKLCESAWMRAIEEKRYREALHIGLSAYLIARDRADQDAELAALTQIKSAVDAMLPAEAREGCSFCGRREEGLRLAAGPDVMICEHCVRDLQEVFAQPPKVAPSKGSEGESVPAT